MCVYNYVIGLASVSSDSFIEIMQLVPHSFTCVNQDKTPSDYN